MISAIRIEIITALRNKGNIMRYPVKLEKDGDGWFAYFPDIPEALTSGTSIEHALQMAKDALITAMDFHFEDGRAVPIPGAMVAGQYAVEYRNPIAD